MAFESINPRFLNVIMDAVSAPFQPVPPALHGFEQGCSAYIFWQYFVYVLEMQFIDNRIRRGNGDESLRFCDENGDGRKGVL